MPVEYSFMATEISPSLPATCSFGGMSGSFGSVHATALPAAIVLKSPPQMIVVSRMSVLRDCRAAV
jgi:hypothetical protein